MEKSWEKAWDHYYVKNRKWWTRLVQTESTLHTNHVHHFRCSVLQCFKCYTIIKTLVWFLPHSPLPPPPPSFLHCYIHVLHTLFVWCCWWSSGHSRPRGAHGDTDESMPSLSPDLWLAARASGTWMSGMNECIKLGYSSVPCVHQLPIRSGYFTVKILSPVCKIRVL